MRGRDPAGGTHHGKEDREGREEGEGKNCLKTTPEKETAVVLGRMSATNPSGQAVVCVAKPPVKCAKVKI